MSCLDISRTCSESNSVAMSRQTISRILIKNELFSYTSLRKPLLRPLDRIKRKRWCKARLHWTDRDWAKVIFSDESNFEVFNRKSRVLVRRKTNEKYESRMVTLRSESELE